MKRYVITLNGRYNGVMLWDGDSTDDGSAGS